jgi:PleD family two-component response regulator
VWVDEIKLRQVMINLIGNAIKFTKEGSISVSFDWDDGEMTITVDDTGQGINDADLKAIFEHFRKTANSDQISRGAGLGLSISREIVQRMGGEMVVESSRNRGTNIKFTIVAPSRVDKSLTDDPLHNSEIVVIDGDNDSRQLIGVFLKGVGAKPYLASTGKDACKHLKNYSPDAVIIDMLVEGEDSINIIQNIRKTSYKGPIVALSAVDNENIRKKVNYAKCDDFFIKPLRRTDFIHKMGILLQRKVLG